VDVALPAELHILASQKAPKFISECYCIDIHSSTEKILHFLAYFFLPFHCFITFTSCIQVLQLHSDMYTKMNPRIWLYCLLYEYENPVERWKTHLLNL